MYQVTQEQFEKMINQSLDTLPKKYVTRLKNVAIVTANEPSQEQRKKLHLHDGQTLYGLYEGIPLTQRGAGYNLILPDIITIFKHPLEWSSHSLSDLQEQVRHTLWHEIAHYFGLNHKHIHRLDGTSNVE